ncbi:MAG: 16S rRNA (adenine(1518)-N(6)/adenine(1519)-N(6))-dimethyltransferase RsmA [Cytophagales bacterium]|jgi:16S rRNA (adenine1518-N6/adenine1519-N6)-dimethyltransferase|nr:16S rRNA (adenine(1518)-N(6)/adenine(1519)-N(6))-dimethyltransferase RsmA [Cytophagales bacterium]
MRSKLGQNFLINQNIAKKISESLNDNEIIIEIGPGEGALTKFLYEKFSDHLFLIEIDKNFIQDLNLRFPRAKIICQDVLQVDFEKLSERKKINVIGNLPYCISTEILFLIHRYRDYVDEVVCMLQKEVVARVCANNCCKQYGIPSVLLQSFFAVEKMLDVGPENFSPEPKVFSSVLRMKRNDIKKLNCNEELFNKVVHCAFQCRRKILKNALGSFVGKNFESEKLNLRAEQLSVSDFVFLTNEIDSFFGKNLSAGG